MALIEPADVLVVGAGPAGWAIAHACGSRGLDTVVVAPRPDGVWTRTYGVWADQLGDLPASGAVASSVWAGDRRLARGYAVLDNAATLAGLRAGPVREVAGVVTGADVRPDGVHVGLRGGEHLAARVVVDASGHRRVLSGGPPRGTRVEQTAFGLFLPEEVAAPVVAPGDAVFMRWGETGDPPTFLYAVPVPGAGTLLEETSLARRAGMPLSGLADRLHRRLGAAGVTDVEEAPRERVRFCLDVPVAKTAPGVVAYGVAAGMMHPATGYSVGDALVTAPAVADAIAASLPDGRAAARAAHAVVWPARARAVHRLREWGLRVLLALPPARVPEFFDVFFGLSPEAQHAYLSGRTDPGATAGAMTALFAAAPWRLRAKLATGWLR